jgi:hypothetical protein
MNLAMKKHNTVSGNHRGHEEKNHASDHLKRKPKVAQKRSLFLMTDFTKYFLDVSSDGFFLLTKNIELVLPE